MNWYTTSRPPLRAVELMGGRKEFGFNFDPANLIYLGIDVENFIDALGTTISFTSTPRMARSWRTTSAAPA